MHRGTAAALLALTLAGCSSAQPAAVSSSSVEDLTGGVVEESTAPSVDYWARQAGCAEYTADKKSDLEIYVADGGTCTLANGNTVTVRRFATDEAMKNWWTIASTMGGDPALVVTTADRIMFDPDDRADLPALKSALGVG